MDIDGGGSIDKDEWLAFFGRLKKSGGEEVVQFVTGYLESRLQSVESEAVSLARAHLSDDDDTEDQSNAKNKSKARQQVKQVGSSSGWEVCDGGVV